MRVAYVCLDPGVPVFGRKGSSVHCQEVMRALQSRGFEVELFAKRLGDDIPQDLENIKKHRIGGKLDRDPDRREAQLVGLNADLAEALTHSRPFDLVYERYSLWSHSAMEFAERGGIPGVLEVNSPLVEEQKRYRTLVNETLAKSIRGKCFAAAMSLITVSNEVAEKIQIAEDLDDKITVVPNGVNVDKFRKLKRTTNNDSLEVVIGFVGTLKPWHGVETLIDAFVKVREINSLSRLRIVGDGPERQNLESRVAQYSDEVRRSVEWEGAVPNAAIPQALSEFEIAVAPYPDLPNFYFSPLKILEYMAAGLPIVASRIGQIPLLLRENETGLLVQPGCKNELASKLLRLVNDPGLRMHLGKAACDKARSEHTWDHVLDRILSTIPGHFNVCGAC